MTRLQRGSHAITPNSVAGNLDGGRGFQPLPGSMTMRRPVLFIVLFIAGFLSTGATSASAQSGTRFSIQGSALFQGLSGDAYECFGGGVGAEGQVRINLENGRSIGAGIQYSRHSFEEGCGITAPLILVGVFMEPRLVLNLDATRAAPYASARLALLRQSTTVNGESSVATGVQLNAGGGILVVANERTNLDIGATIGAVQFGTYSNGNDAGSGLNFVLRVGISLAVGR